MSELGVIIGAIVCSVVLVIVALFVMLSRYYVKTTADRAYVKTGRGKPKVVVNGGDWVIPIFNEQTWVDLRTMDIDIERTGANALLTKDPQYADIRAIFYIKVNPTNEDIERAARTIGGGEVKTDNVKRLVESKLEGALRDVAATFTLMSLHQEREKFVERVQTLVRADLSENGLLLESVSITALKSARQGSFGVDDVFGAQVARANAEVIQRALKERNEIDQGTQTDIARRNASAEQERNEIEVQKQLELTRRNQTAKSEQNDIERGIELEITRRNAEVDQEKLNLERNVSQARATQQREILIRESEERSAAEKVSYEQQQQAELARVLKERAIAEAETTKQQAIMLAEQRKQQAIELAEQEREREVQRSKVLKEQAIQVADQERKIALAQQQAQLEAAEKERLAIAAQREQAEQDVFTVQERATAERDSQIQIINAERDARRELINRKNEIEISALQRVKEAEAEAEALNRKAVAEAEAAIKLAEARRTEAQASSDSEKLRAEAARAMAAAQGLAEAEVITAKAEAARMEAEAIRARALAEAEGQRAMADALAANDGVAQRLELERIRISAQIEVGVAQAKAVGSALSAMDFKLYGSPETAAQILRFMTFADGFGDLIQNVPAPVKDLGSRLIDRIVPATNGNGGTTHADGMVPNLGAAAPLVAEGAAVITTLLTPEEAGQPLQSAIELALTRADDSQRMVLLRVQGMLALVPQVAALPLEQVLKQ